MRPGSAPPPHATSYATIAYPSVRVLPMQTRAAGYAPSSSAPVMSVGTPAVVVPYGAQVVMLPSAPSHPPAAVQHTHTHTHPHPHHAPRACDAVPPPTKKEDGRPSATRTCSSGVESKAAAPAVAEEPRKRKKYHLKGSTGTVTLWINGSKMVLKDVSPLAKLNDFLRETPGLTGTKHSCGEAGCGACTVAMETTDAHGNVHQKTVNSCVRPLAACDGQSFTTIEGIGNSRTGLNPIQERLAKYNGSQCGYCSPGMVMAMYGLLKSNPSPTHQDVEDHFDGNICRCTGYRPILDAFQSFVGDEEGTSKAIVANASPLCTSKPDFARRWNTPLRIRSPGGVWLRPTNLDDLKGIITNNSSSTIKLVVGNTSIGIYKEEKEIQLPDIWVDISAIPFMNTQTIGEYGLHIGGAVSISDFIALIEKAIATLPAEKTRTYAALLRHLHLVANVHVRNAGSVAGNIMLQHQFSFLSDIYTILMSVGTVLTIVHADGKPSSTVNLTDFLTYDMTGAFIQTITLQFSTPTQVLETFKTMYRHQNAHAIVNAAFNVEMNDSGVVTAAPTIVYGGIKAKACRASQLEAFLVGKSLWDSATLKGGLDVLKEHLVPAMDTSQPHQQYRTSLVYSLFYKFILARMPSNSIPPKLRSAANQYKRPISSGEISYGQDKSEFPAGEALPKTEAPLQTSGEAIYTDDILSNSSTLNAAFVTSTAANADIESIDASDALSFPGVVAVYTAKNLTEAQNRGVTMSPTMPAEYGEELFASKHVAYYGQSIGLVVAEEQWQAHYAAQLVHVTYTNEKTPILTLEDAIKQKSFFPPIPGSTVMAPLKVGDVSKGFASSTHILEGSIPIESQYHFHMETQTCVAVPGEGQRLHVHSATQWPARTQRCVSSVIGVPSSKIEVSVERIGGAYGGKITRCIIPSCGIAFAAHQLNRPVRMQMNLNTNMRMIGKRHPFICNYKIGFEDTGKVNALQLHYYNDGGHAIGACIGTMDMAMTTADNCYNFPNYYLEGVCARTNLPANTSMRAPGCVPSIYFIEQIMEMVAEYLSLTPSAVKALNFYSKGDVTPYGQTLTYWNLPKVWTQLQASADYESRLKAVNQFNADNRWVKRGISLVPIKYGITGSARYGVSVCVYTDGTVGVNQSGVEMGQGINMKVSQVVAYELGIPLSMVTIEATSSKTIPDADPTGGSIGSGLNSKAAIDACTQLKKRLSPLKALLGGDTSWEELITKAYGAGVCLIATGWSWDTTAEPFAYNSYGTACSEVQVDILTGQVEVLRSDILFDCGTSLNPLVDVGQVQGAFIMGLGYFLTEKLIFDYSTGELLSDGTWEYKPPESKDIPEVFNVALLKDAPNPVGVLRSKASGEPPYCMACSMFFAVQHAINSSRKDAGLSTTGLPITQPAMVYKIPQAAGVSESQLTTL